jgi:hypothetical protein
MKFCLFLFLLLSLSAAAYSQEVLENNPPSVKWSQVNTPHFRVIFPRGFDEQGQRVASKLEAIHEVEAKSLGSYPRKISVILQNESAESNGFVSFLPRRSEFYTMPSQNYNFMGTNDWLDLLISHEYRHIVQYQHAFRGFTKMFYYVFGGATFAGMAQVAAPDWFWEGDAVVTETAFTPSGRGKIPAFSRLFRTNLLEGRTFNYHKQYLRSYKHNIPDHYVLGYHMVNYLRKRTGDPEIWGKVSARAWRTPFVPFIFSTSIKKQSGLSVNQLYRSMASDLKKEWKEELDKLTLTKFESIPVKRRRAYTDFLYPQPLSNKRVLVLKKGIAHIDTYVLLNGNLEEKVFTPGFTNDTGMLSAQDHVVVWNEYGYDPRFSVRNYSLIKAYDLNTRKRFVVGGKHSRYAGVSISPDLSKVVTVRTGRDYHTNMVVLSFPEGQVLKTFHNPKNAFYSMARFSSDGEQVVALKTLQGKRSVVMINVQTGIERKVLGPTDENIGHPVLHGDLLLYNSPATGIDNIYAYRIGDGKHFQVTESRLGAYNPAVNKEGTILYYNEQQKNGMDVVFVPFAPANWKALEAAPPVDSSSFGFLVEQEQHRNIIVNIPTQSLPVTPFSRASGILKPYAWGFFFENNIAEANLGISTQNLLSTTKLETGYVYNIGERASAWKASLSYQALYPIVDIAATYANRKVTEDLEDGDIQFEWREKTVEGGLRIPVVTTSGKFAGALTFGGTAGVTRVDNFSNNVDDGGRLFGDYFFREYIDNGDLLFGHLTASGYRLLKRSRRDINSKWGQRFFIDHYATPFGGDFAGELTAATGILYFPGFLRNHSIWGHAAWQKTAINRSEENYLFQNEVPIPRGQSVGRYQEFASFSVNYTLPVWYPDLSIGPLLNIQRFRANGFLDYGFGRNRLVSTSQVYSSIGGELKVDFNIFRFLPQIDVGIRYSYGLEPRRSQIEVLIGTINF